MRTALVLLTLVLSACQEVPASDLCRGSFFSPYQRERCEAMAMTADLKATILQETAAIKDQNKYLLDTVNKLQVQVDHLEARRCR